MKLYDLKQIVTVLLDMCQRTRPGDDLMLIASLRSLCEGPPLGFSAAIDGRLQTVIEASHAFTEAAAPGGDGYTAKLIELQSSLKRLLEEANAEEPDDSAVGLRARR
jgi:hypothetical protein